MLPRTQKLRSNFIWLLVQKPGISNWLTREVRLVADTSFARIESGSSCRLLATLSHSGATFYVLSVLCRLRRSRSSLTRFPPHQQALFILSRVAAAPEARATDIVLPPRRAIRLSNATSAAVAAAAAQRESRRQPARAVTAVQVPAIRLVSAGLLELIWTPSSAKSPLGCVARSANWSARLRWSRLAEDATLSRRRRQRWLVR